MIRHISAAAPTQIERAILPKNRSAGLQFGLALGDPNAPI